MKNVVNEPQAVYERAGWQTKFENSITMDFTLGIENGTVIYRLQGSSSCNILPVKPKRKLSALKGKQTKQSNKEIDEQISKLRTEWDRNF